MTTRTALQKLAAAIAAAGALLLLACEDPATNGADPDPDPPAAAVSPPSWILGTWTNCVDVGSSLNVSWTFTADNAVATAQSITVDYAEHSEQPGVDLEEASGATWYRLQITADGTTTVYRFELDGSRLLLTSTIGGASLGTLPLCR